MQRPASLPDLSSQQLKDASGRGVIVAARLGYLTHGLIYGMVGSLALLAALGRSSGQITDSEGAVEQIGRTDWGEPLSWAVAIGLGCYALWGAIRALLDPEHLGRDSRALVKRGGYLVSAASHALLSVYTFQLAAGSGRHGHGKTQTIAEVLTLPGGRIAIGAAGLGVIGFGLVELYRGFADRVGWELSGAALSRRQRLIALRVARVGVAARGLVFSIIGGSLLLAAIKARSSEAYTIGDALRELASQPFGLVLLALVAAGLVAYAIFQLVLARYARVPSIQ